MKAHQRWRAAATVAASLTLLGCTEAPKAAEKRQGPAKVTAVDGSKIKQVTLTEQAVKRIGLEMTAITEDAGTRVIPYASVVYDENGNTFAFTSPAALTFVRSPITVATITGDKAFLSDGPATGTQVVTVGTAELYGTEQGLGY
jgi:hypothetical protein